MEILFTASPGDIGTLRYLASLDVPFIKIGSGDAENLEMIRVAAGLKKPLLISTGMCDMKSVLKIFNEVHQQHKMLALMHCVSSYPTPEEQLNLNVIQTYLKSFPNYYIG